jgi:hypothetical protein
VLSLKPFQLWNVIVWAGAGQTLIRIGGGSDEEISDAELEELLKQNLAESSVRMYVPHSAVDAIIEKGNEAVPPFSTSLP